MNIGDISGFGSAFDFARSVIDKIWPPQADPNEKLKAQTAIQQAIEARDNQVVSAQREIIVAEMQQGDLYTKRARPTVVYMGLAFIALVHVLLPVTLKIIMVFKLGGDMSGTELLELRELMDISLPAEFWWAWSSVVGIWELGRTFERRGLANKVISSITGNGK